MPDEDRRRLDRNSGVGSGVGVELEWSWSGVGVGVGVETRRVSEGEAATDYALAYASGYH